MIFSGRSRTSRFALGGIGAVLAGTAAAVIGYPAAASPDARVAAGFEWMDRDRDNRLSAGEFLTPPDGAPATSDIGIIIDTRTPPVPGETREALFRRIDSNADGAISLAELDAASRVQVLLSPDIVTADENGNGVVTEGELVAWIVARRAAAGAADPRAGAALMARGIVANLDSDGDGTVPIEALLRR